MLIKPRYIETARIDSPQIRFQWDECNVHSIYQPVDALLVERLLKLSKHANCAFTLAVAEWIVYRFQRLDDDPQPSQYLEAAWAANVSIEYADEMVFVDEEWSGPVRGPISMALSFVVDALFAEEANPNSPLNPAWAARFARHVLPRDAEFVRWFDESLKRLEALFPAPAEEDLDWFDASGNWGALVPREVFDPEFAFKVEMTNPLINEFLAGLRYQANPFLHSPGQMRELGFKGVPYVLGEQFPS